MLRKIKYELLLLLIIAALYNVFLLNSVVRLEDRVERLSQNKEGLIYKRQLVLAAGRDRWAEVNLRFNDEILRIAVNNKILNLVPVKEFFGVSALKMRKEGYLLPISLVKGDNTVEVFARSANYRPIHNFSVKLAARDYLGLFILVISLSSFFYAVLYDEQKLKRANFYLIAILLALISSCLISCAQPQFYPR